MDEERLHRVLRALLEVEGCTEAEAETRRQKAAELMLQAGVTEEDIRKADTPELMRLTGEINRVKWNLAKYVGPAVARLSGCICYTQDVLSKSGRRTDRKKMTFVGYAPDVDNATWLLNHLLDQGLTAVRIAGLRPHQTEGKDMLAAFGVTVTTRILDLANRMDVVREECRAQATDRALVEVDKEDIIHEYLRTKGIILVKASRAHTKARSRDAIALGKAAGDRATFGRPVSAGGRPMLTKGDRT